jgi:hypothetical protein
MVLAHILIFCIVGNMSIARIWEVNQSDFSLPQQSPVIPVAIIAVTPSIAQDTTTLRQEEKVVSISWRFHFVFSQE